MCNFILMLVVNTNIDMSMNPIFHSDLIQNYENSLDELKTYMATLTQDINTIQLKTLRLSNTFLGTNFLNQKAFFSLFLETINFPKFKKHILLVMFYVLCLVYRFDDAFCFRC